MKTTRRHFLTVAGTPQAQQRRMISPTRKLTITKASLRM
jgi:hypothetical protein